MLSPGEELLELCAQAKEDVVLVSPFIKSAALKRVLEAIPNKNTSITCVARWRPEEIAAGVCDVEIFDVIKQRPGARLFIHPLLHAKFFRVDDRCLLGSANLTQRALGWVTPANLELLLEAPAKTLELKQFEETLFSTAFEASETLRDQMASEAKYFQSEGLHAKLLSGEGLSDDEVGFSASGWLPLCPWPEQLYKIYSGDTKGIIEVNLRLGQRDLRSLQIPSGLSHAAFCQMVAASIQQTPIMRVVYEATARNLLTPQDGQELIRSGTFSLEYDLDLHWNTVRDWLLYFLPQVYRQPYGSSDLQRGVKIGEFRVRS